MWRIRAGRELPRYLLCAASAAGLLASARYAIAPPRAPARASAAVSPAADRAAEGFALLFARRYLSWRASEPQASARTLEQFFAAATESSTGLALPSAGEQQVQWAEVVQAREPQPGVHDYTVAAQTDSDGLLYLSVPVERVPDGAVRLADYPAFVGAPASGPASLPPAHLREVDEPALRTVVERGLRNYLADAPQELDADLAAGSRVSLPPVSLALESVQRLDWAEAGDSVLAVVQAHDSRGTEYVLAYELEVLRRQGRWEISAVQVDPDS